MTSKNTPKPPQSELEILKEMNSEMEKLINDSKKFNEENKKAINKSNKEFKRKWQ